MPSTATTSTREQPIPDPRRPRLDRDIAMRLAGTEYQRVVASLAELEPDEWWCVCPIDPVPSHRPFRIRERGGVAGASLEVACAHEDCTEADLLRELRRLEWRRMYGSVDAPPEAVAA